MAKGRPPLRPRWAELVFDKIPHDRWITGNDLMALTGLTYMQVVYGVAYLRDNFPDFPLVSSKQGYRFSVDAREVRAFAAWRAKTALTIMRHAYRGVVAPYLQTVGAREKINVTKQFERALEDLGDLVSATP